MNFLSETCLALTIGAHPLNNRDEISVFPPTRRVIPRRPFAPPGTPKVPSSTPRAEAAGPTAVEATLSPCIIRTKGEFGWIIDWLSNTALPEAIFREPPVWRTRSKPNSDSPRSWSRGMAVFSTSPWTARSSSPRNRQVVFLNPAKWPPPSRQRLPDLMLLCASGEAPRFQGVFAPR